MESVLLYHVVPGAPITYRAAKKADGAQPETANGAKLKVDYRKKSGMVAWSTRTPTRRTRRAPPPRTSTRATGRSPTASRRAAAVRPLTLRPGGRAPRGFPGVHPHVTSRPRGSPSLMAVTNPPVLTIAHRGASAYAPENTLAALRAAIELRCDLAEVDVQRTRDGVLVLVHDTDLRRATGHHLRVGTSPTPTSPRSTPAPGSRPVYAGERVPALKQALDVLDGTGTGLLLEVKHPAPLPGHRRRHRPDAPRPPGIRRLRPPQLVQSFDHGVMRDFARLQPGSRSVSSATRRPSAPRPRHLGRHVDPRHRRATAAYVDAVHAAGMYCLVWTVDEGPDLHRALSLGVDGIISNRPDVLQRLASDRLVAA